ncbi:MAG: asparaginase [Peptoniphilaceae bacterium]|nr:asparaginase [Peptoniphilaceae bacterium]MDY6085140.1 asparaginase [Peptoniphilaceae bacterium]
MKPHILLIGTGGTIASVHTKDGLSPGVSAAALLDHVASATDFCTITPLDLFYLDSTNIETRHWLQIEACIEENYDAYDGFVICHGTDTMAYTAAALSYLVQHSPKPIVLTGAQKPIDSEDTDARRNLIDSLRFASDPRARDVSVVFQGSVICGTHVQKERTKSFNAFVSLNLPPVAAIQDERIFMYLSAPEGEPPVRFYHHMDTSVALVKLIPSMQPEILKTIAASCRALIIESYGVGGLPQYDARSFSDIVRELLDEGKIVVMTTQVPYEGSDFSIYKVSRIMQDEPNLWEAHDMTLASVVTKLMWILSEATDREAARALFEAPVNRDSLWFG